MIDTPDNCVSSCFLCNIMEQCSRQCIRRTFFAVLVGVSPIVICLLFIGLARLILYRLEMAYYRRQKFNDRRPSIFSYQSGRLALSYTPVSDAELQRIIQGEYQSPQMRDFNNFGTSRRAPKFIRSILTRRESALPASSILSNLVIRRNAIDTIPMTAILPAIDTPLHPTFSIINEQDKRRASAMTIGKESLGTSTITTTMATTTTVAAMNNNHNNNTNNNNNNDNNDNGNLSPTNNLIESEPMTIDHIFTPVKTLTTVVVEDFLEFHSVSSLPALSTVLSSITENNTEKNTQINKT